MLSHVPGHDMSNSPYIAGLGTLPPPSSLTSVSLLTGSYQGHPLGTSSVALDTTSTTNVMAPGITTWPSISVPPSTSIPMVNPTQVSPQHSAGLVISPAAAPFPKKLVDKVKSGQFVEMKELLVDNIALMRQLEAMHGTSNLPQFSANRPQLREVSSLTTWCYCFLGYMAIHTADPTTRDQLAYARLIIREAQRHGGKGWLDYDRSFRQQAAIDPLTRWNTLSPGLLASTVLCQRAQRGTQFCTLCREVDHTMFQCALYYCYAPNTCSAHPDGPKQAGPSAISFTEPEIAHSVHHQRTLPLSGNARIQPPLAPCRIQSPLAPCRRALLCSTPTMSNSNC